MKDEFPKLLLEVIPPLIRLIRSEIKIAAANTLSFPQYRVLANINRGLQTVSEIAEHQGVSQPAMTKTVNILVKQGLISRKKSDIDARQTILTLTPEGKKLRQKIRSLAQKKLGLHLKGIGAKDQKKIIDSLMKIKNEIDLQV